jgi:mitochondrial fission protein ELM1
VHLNRALPAVTAWSDDDWQSAIERLNGSIHQVTSVKLTLFDQLFQHYMGQLLQEVGNKATGPKSTFARNLLK